MTKLKLTDFLVILLFLQLITYVTLFLDIPVARQVLGFMFFTFVPGFLIKKLLKLDKLDVVETVLFSVGLSIAFLMIIGLLINDFGLLLGFSRPLSLTTLMIIFNGIILIIGVVVHSRNVDFSDRQKGYRKMGWVVLPLLFLPVLSIVGAMLVNISGNNLLLLFMLIAVSLLFVIGVISKKLSRSKLYPLVVVVIAISLLYHSSLISKYIVSFGSDVTFEYFIFRTSADSAHWNSTLPSTWGEQYGRLNAMLSITILPTIYSSLLNIDPTFVFRIMFPLILSMVPLALYRTWEKYVGKKYAFISVFLFMAQATFYTEMLGLNRQIIGELFFAMLFLVILTKKIEPAKKFACFVIFGFGLVVSHYALAEIFLFFIFFAIIPLLLLKRSSRKITVTMIVFSLVIMFTWYIYTSNSAVFDSFLSFGDNIYRQLGDFADIGKRDEDVLKGLGLVGAPSVWNYVSRAFAYITEALIVVGFVGLALKKTKIRFDMDYLMLTTVAMALLAALILVPGLADTLNMTRFYHILLFFSAPLCVLGAETLAGFVSRRKTQMVASILLLSVITPYFFFQTGFVYEITGSESWSLPLSMHRMEGYKLIRLMGTIPGQNVYGAFWLSESVDFESTKIYADLDSRDKALIVYGLISPIQVSILSNTTETEDSGIIYLGQLNVAYGIVDSGSMLWNISSRSPLFGDISKIYSNGGCEIYKNTNAASEG